MADAEKQEELKNLGKSTKRQSKWTYLTLDQVSELSPSVKDGLEKTKEAHWRRSYLHVIQEAGMRLRMCVGGGLHRVWCLTRLYLGQRGLPTVWGGAPISPVPLLDCRPQWGIASAALLCHRFFSKKSMKKNDRYVSVWGLKGGT